MEEGASSSAAQLPLHSSPEPWPSRRDRLPPGFAIEKAGYWYGYRRFGYYRIAATIGVPGIIGPTPTAITGRIAMAIGGGPIIAVTGSLIWIDQDRSASRRS